MNARIGLLDVSNLPDPLMEYQFQLLVPNIPGQGSGQGLSVRCKTSSIPGSEIEDVITQLHGVEVGHAGMPKFSHKLQCSFQETRDMYVRDTIRKWQDFQKDIRNTSGNYKAQYATIAQMQLFDDTNAIIRVIQLFGFRPTTLDDSNMDGGSSSGVLQSTTFWYDLWQDVE